MTTAEQQLELRRQPDQPVVMRQSWLDLTFLHWIVDPDVIRPYIPADLELDLWNDECYIGLVPFTMKDVCPIGVPRFRPLTDFHETNVRTYVKHRGKNPGVWFFSLEAANQLAVSVARAWFGLPYHFADMSLKKTSEIVEYRSSRIHFEPKARCNVVSVPMGPRFYAKPGTLEFFLSERYLLYCQRNGKLLSGRVIHDPYPLQTARALEIDQTLLDVLGISVAHDPVSTLYSPGVKVKLFQPVRVVNQ